MNIDDKTPQISSEELDAAIELYTEGLLSRQEERALAMILMERETLTPTMESALVQMGLESVLGKREPQAVARKRKPWYRRPSTGWSAAACVAVLACIGVSLLNRQPEAPVVDSVEIYSEGRKIEVDTRQRAEAYREIAEVKQTVEKSMTEARREEQSVSMELQLDRYLETAAIDEARKERYAAVQEVRRSEQYVASTMNEAAALKKSMENDIMEAGRIKADIARELSESQAMIEETKNLK